MRRMKRTSSEEDAIDISPLIDVVFILLIFFMVSTTFVKDAQLELQRPSAQSAEAADKQSPYEFPLIERVLSIWVKKPYDFGCYNLEYVNNYEAHHNQPYLLLQIVRLPQSYSSTSLINAEWVEQKMWV